MARCTLTCASLQLTLTAGVSFVIFVFTGPTFQRMK